MRLSSLFIGGVTASLASACTIKPCSGRCVFALSATPAVGEAFCSSYLSLAPATETVTEVSTVTPVHTDIETEFSIQTLTTATITVTGPTITVLGKREAPSPAPSEDILSQCSYASARIRSACSCFLSTTSTVSETITRTDVAETTITMTETLTARVVATDTVSPTYTAQPIINGDFASYPATNNILPWTNTSATTGGTIDVASGRACTAYAAYCGSGSSLLRVYPPAGGFTSIMQTITARPSETYNVSFFYRCISVDTSVGIDLYYAGNRIGGVTCPSQLAVGFDLVTSGFEFTTDVTGTGELEVRFLNPTTSSSEWMYADDFIATRVDASD